MKQYGQRSLEIKTVRNINCLNFYHCKYFCVILIEFNIAGSVDAKEFYRKIKAEKNELTNGVDVTLEGLCRNNFIWYEILCASKHFTKEWFIHLEYYEQSKQDFPSGTAEEPFELDNYYISRYQAWPEVNNCYGNYSVKISNLIRCRLAKIYNLWPFFRKSLFWSFKVKLFRFRCNIKFKFKYFKGHWLRGSCSFGVGDVRWLLHRPELVAHKFHANIEPAGYFCIYRTLRSRALDTDSQRRFIGKNYANLPQVRLAIDPSLTPTDVQFYFKHRNPSQK